MSDSPPTSGKTIGPSGKALVPPWFRRTTPGRLLGIVYIVIVLLWTLDVFCSRTSLTSNPPYRSIGQFAYWSSPPYDFGRWSLSGLGISLAVTVLPAGFVLALGRRWMIVSMGLALLTGLGAAMLIVSPAKVANAQEVREHCERDLAGLTLQLFSYYWHAGHFPTQEQGLQALVTKPTTEPIPKRWNQLHRVLPLDQWRRPFEYTTFMEDGKEVIVLRSHGPDPDSTDDDFESRGDSEDAAEVLRQWQN